MYVWALVIGAFVVISGYAAWYKWRIRSGIKRAPESLPPANQLSRRMTQRTSLALQRSSAFPDGGLAPIIDATVPPLRDGRDPIGAEPSGVADAFEDPITWAAGADSTVVGWSILESAL